MMGGGISLTPLTDHNGLGMELELYGLWTTGEINVIVRSNILISADLKYVYFSLHGSMLWILTSCINT